jgi:hypothetical protein
VRGQVAVTHEAIDSLQPFKPLPLSFALSQWIERQRAAIHSPPDWKVSATVYNEPGVKPFLPVRSFKFT